MYDCVALKNVDGACSGANWCVDYYCVSHGVVIVSLKVIACKSIGFAVVGMFLSQFFDMIVLIIARYIITQLVDVRIQIITADGDSGMKVAAREMLCMLRKYDLIM